MSIVVAVTVKNYVTIDNNDRSVNIQTMEWKRLLFCNKERMFSRKYCIDG